MSDASVQSVAGMQHALLHFTSNHEDWSRFPIIVSGRGVRVTDQLGREYLDGIAGLYTTQVGHGRGELAEVAAEQIRTLEYMPNWSLHHPRVLELSERLASIAPVDGPASAYFVNSGSEAIEAMIKLVRQYHAARGEAGRFKFVARQFAYHGVTAGALALTGIPALRAPFEPLPPIAIHVPNTQQDPDGAAEAIAAAIEFGPPEQVAAVVLEPVQNAGGCLVPPEGYWRRVREICDRHGVLLVADATICAFGRLGTWFGVERFDVRPDIVTFAKGLTSGYIPMGGLLVSDRIRKMLDREAMYLHGSTFGGHPVAAAVALANLDIIEREGLLERASSLETLFGELLSAMGAEHPMVRDVRGLGLFWAVELDTSYADGRPLVGEEYDRHFKHNLFHNLIDLGLLCRVDDRDSPVLQFAPPLTVTEDDLRHIVDITGRGISALERALGY